MKNIIRTEIVHVNWHLDRHLTKRYRTIGVLYIWVMIFVGLVTSVDFSNKAWCLHIFKYEKLTSKSINLFINPSGVNIICIFACDDVEFRYFDTSYMAYFLFKINYLHHLLLYTVWGCIWFTSSCGVVLRYKVCN